MKKASSVESFDENLRRFLDDMAETMYAAPGVGLAAPQVGVLLRAIVVDASPKVEGTQLIKLVNPVIISAEGKSIYEEGCLSVPGFTAEVTRASKIWIEGFDEYGKPVNIETNDFLATVIQHEIDHLNGILFIDHLGRLRRDLIRRKLRKQARQNDKSKEKQAVRYSI